MLIPLKLEVDMLERTEDFNVDDEVRKLMVGADPDRYRVRAIVLDTERGLIQCYEFHSMRSSSDMPYRAVGQIITSPVGDNHGPLKAIRDELDKVLGDREAT